MWSVMSREQNAEHSHNIETGNRPCKSVADFRYLGRTVTNEDCIYEELRADLIRVCLLPLDTDLVYSLKVLFLYVCRTWYFT
jgi:hypothetical protein